MGLKILVSGASGFIGQHLIRHLIRNSHTVHALKSPLDDFEGARLSLEQLQPDWLIHLAGMSSVGGCAVRPATAYHVNTGGTLNLLEACIQSSRKTRMLFASTAQVYQGAPDFSSQEPNAVAAWTEDRTVEPQNTYARTKATAEAGIYSLAHAYGLSPVILRLFNHTHHTQSPDFLLPHLHQSLLEQKEKGPAANAIPVGNLDLWRDLGVIQDLLNAFSSAVERLPLSPGQAEIYNICSGTAKRLADIADQLARTLGVEPQFVVDPNRIRHGEPKVIQGSHQKFTDATGWSPEATDAAKFVEGFLSPLPF